eukprot:735045_1
MIFCLLSCLSMAVLLLVLLSMIGTTVLSQTINIDYHNEAQAVTVTKQGSPIDLNFGDIVELAGPPNQVQIVYVGNGNWRRKEDELSTVWPSQMYTYDAEYIHGLSQFELTGDQILDGQLDENQGYTDTTTANNAMYHAVIKTEFSDSQIDFRRSMQQVTVQKDGTDISLGVGDIVLMDGRDFTYVGNQQWMGRLPNDEWDYDCVETITADQFSALSQFQTTATTITPAETAAIEATIDDSCATNPPSKAPSVSTASPSGSPSETPSSSPSEIPSNAPSKTPSRSPTKIPSVSPSKTPSGSPSETPSGSPSKTPSRAPSKAPSELITDIPSGSPSKTPSSAPSESPSGSPSKTPSGSPSEGPSRSPSKTPSDSPSKAPLELATESPSSSSIETTSLFDSSQDTDPISGVQRHNVFGVLVILGLASCF